MAYHAAFTGNEKALCLKILYDVMVMHTQYQLAKLELHAHPTNITPDREQQDAWLRAILQRESSHADC